MTTPSQLWVVEYPTGPGTNIGRSGAVVPATKGGPSHLRRGAAAG